MIFDGPLLTRIGFLAATILAFGMIIYQVIP